MIFTSPSKVSWIFSSQRRFAFSQRSGLIKVLKLNGFNDVFLHLTQFTAQFASRDDFGIAQADSGTGFVDQINGFVGQVTIGDIAIAQLLPPPLPLHQ